MMERYSEQICAVTTLYNYGWEERHWNLGRIHLLFQLIFFINFSQTLQANAGTAWTRTWSNFRKNYLLDIQLSYSYVFWCYKTLPVGTVSLEPSSFLVILVILMKHLIILLVAETRRGRGLTLSWHLLEGNRREP